jgi:hypothetical protein
MPCAASSWRFPEKLRADMLARMRITTTVLPVVVVFLLSSSAFAQTLCFTLADTTGYIDFKVEVKPTCKVTQAGKSVRISSVHGTARGYETGGSPAENFLLVGTCEGTESFVNLIAAPLGESKPLEIYGPSLETGTARWGPLQGPVVPVSCSSLGL